ncbi:MAG: carbohydrate kinase family protein [Patescibacteria group bacterium]|nr:carbohydrate kinase family protein [Patescibacteria group bacterium]
MFSLFRKFGVCTVGAGTRDVFIKSSHFEREPNAKAPEGFDACFPMGAKIPLEDVIFETGGGATNAAVTLRRFGLRTACICAVGHDQNGQDVVAALEREKVNTRGIQIHPDKKTAYSVILLAGTGQRSILAYRGAGNSLNTQRVHWKKFKSRWFYITSLGGDLKKNREVFSKAASFKTKIAWNPGNGELAHGLKLLAPLIKQTDVFIVNRDEAAMLTHENRNNLNRMLKELGKMPQTALVITDGGKGAYVYDVRAGQLLYSPALPGKRLNTTGAGDSFGSAFVAAFIKTKSCQDGLKAGLLNSLGVITHMGAKAGILKSFPSKKDMARVRVKVTTKQL